jgi:putrescine---pyruvate transaminase
VGEVIQNANEVFAHVFTNCGHPVGAAVALENLAVIEEENLVKKVRKKVGPYFNKRLQDLLELPCVGDVRSLGVMGAFDVDASSGARTSTTAENDAFLSKVASIAWERGVVVRGGGMCLPMIITEAQIDEAIGLLHEAIGEAWRAHQT